MEIGSGSIVAECFWPDVREEDVRAVEQRILTSLEGARVRYLGSILIRKDDVVLCQFEGTAAAVRKVAERARLPFDRLLEATIATPTKETSSARRGRVGR